MSPESFIPVWLSVGEAQQALRSDELPVDLSESIAHALEDERPRSFEEMERERQETCS